MGPFGGLVLEEDIYTQSVNVNILYTSLTAGLGYQDKGMKLDAKFLMGPETGLDTSGYKGLSLDAEIQGTIFL